MEVTIIGKGNFYWCFVGEDLASEQIDSFHWSRTTELWVPPLSVTRLNNE